MVTHILLTDCFTRVTKQHVQSYSYNCALSSLESIHSYTPPKPPTHTPHTHTLAHRECLMAMMAAMKKVLSPISETMMTEKAATKAWKNPTLTHCTTSSVISPTTTWREGGREREGEGRISF